MPGNEVLVSVSLAQQSPTTRLFLLVGDFQGLHCQPPSCGGCHQQAKLIFHLKLEKVATRRYSVYFSDCGNIDWIKRRTKEGKQCQRGWKICPWIPGVCTLLRNVDSYGIPMMLSLILSPSSKPHTFTSWLGYHLLVATIPGRRVCKHRHDPRGTAKWLLRTFSTALLVLLSERAEIRILESFNPFSGSAERLRQWRK